MTPLTRHSPISAALGIDVGSKRVGIALYRQDQAAITPLPTPERASKRAESTILNLIEVHHVSLLVVGIPLSADDQQTAQSDDVRGFMQRLSKRCNVSIEYEDEYLSSEEAQQLLGISGSPNRSVRESGLIDGVAAAIILQRRLKALGSWPTVELGSLPRRIASLSQNAHYPRCPRTIKK